MERMQSKEEEKPTQPQDGGLRKLQILTLKCINQNVFIYFYICPLKTMGHDQVKLEPYIFVYMSSN